MSCGSTPKAGASLFRCDGGLVPMWWQKALKSVPATFNARAETVADKPMFRDAGRFQGVFKVG